MLLLNNNDLLVIAQKKLAYIHENIILKHGNWKKEYQEQLLSCRFINPNSCVLEIGANIGRNTMVIASMLTDDKNLVTLECNPTIVDLLKDNKTINHFNFNIEDSALSKRKLIQKGWITIPSPKDEIPLKYTQVKTITFQELEAKYNIKFNTLVVDCEGALYYIFIDDMDMLNDINLILMENDYLDITHKQKVDEIMISKGFKRIYFKAGGWKGNLCWEYFYEVWQK